VEVFQKQKDPLMETRYHAIRRAVLYSDKTREELQTLCWRLEATTLKEAREIAFEMLPKEEE
jgi:hypothetical protein